MKKTLTKYWKLFNIKVWEAVSILETEPQYIETNVTDEAFERLGEKTLRFKNALNEQKSISKLQSKEAVG